MRRRTGITLFLMGALCFSGHAALAESANLSQKAPPIRADYRATRIATHTYVIHAPTELPNPRNQGFMSNMAFVVTRDSVVVFDTGPSVQAGELLVKKIKSVTRFPVTHVFNSHKHGDHWLGNQAIADAWPQARFYAHPADIQAARDEGDVWMRRFNDMTDGATAGTVARAPDQPVRNGQRFRVGGMDFVVHHYGPSHTPGSILLEVPQDKVLLMGDNLFAGRAAGLQDADIRGNVRALDQARALPVTHIVPGHGRTDGKPLLDDFHAYLDTLRASVKKYRDQGMTDFEMKDKVIADMARFRHLSGFNEMIGQHINRMHAELEREEFG